MDCPDPQFQADFFNNVAAVAIVLVFAKVVAHRKHDEPSVPRALLHGLAVLAAVAAAGLALWVTHTRVDSCLWHWLAGGALVVAGLVFFGEILLDDVYPALKRKRCSPKPQQDPTPEPN